MVFIEVLADGGKRSYRHDHRSFRAKLLHVITMPIGEKPVFKASLYFRQPRCSRRNCCEMNSQVEYHVHRASCKILRFHDLKSFTLYCVLGAGVVLLS